LVQLFPTQAYAEGFYIKGLVHQYFNLQLKKKRKKKEISRLKQNNKIKEQKPRE